MNNYKLFLDDERFPPDDGNHWDIVRSARDAYDFFIKKRCPDFISFDHDLGEDGTGKDVANWIIKTDLDYKGKFIPDGFDFRVHSQNPIGAKNISELLNQYLEHRKNLTK